MSTKLVFVGGFLAGLVVGVGGLLLTEDKSVPVAENQPEDAQWLSGMALDTSSQLALERGLTFSALYDVRPIGQSAREEIETRRKNFDFRIRDLLAKQKTSGTDVARMEGLLEELKAMRGRVDEALSVSADKRSALVADDWFKSASSILERLSSLAYAAQDAGAQTDTEGKLLRISANSLSLGEAAGRERAIIGAALSSGKPIATELAWQLNWARYQVDSEWKKIKLLAADIEGEPSLAQAVKAFEASYFETVRKQSRAVDPALFGRGDYTITPEEWLTRSTEAIDDVVAIGLIAGQIASR